MTSWQGKSTGGAHEEPGGFLFHLDSSAVIDDDVQDSQTEESESWLISYTDTVTLLITLFVMLLAHSVVADKNAVLAQGVVPVAVEGAVVQTGDGGEYGAVVNEVGMEDAGVQSADPEKLRHAEAMRETIRQAGIQDKVEVEALSGQIEVRMNEKVLFPVARAELSEEGEALLGSIAQLLAAGDYRIIVEGYTDNVPIATYAYPSNWELSSARALSVVHHLESVGIPSERLSAVAFGETHPIDTNDTPEGRQRNRRVQIVLR